MKPCEKVNRTEVEGTFFRLIEVDIEDEEGSVLLLEFGWIDDDGVKHGPVRGVPCDTLISIIQHGSEILKKDYGSDTLGEYSL